LHAATEGFVSADVDGGVKVIAHHRVRVELELEAILGFAKAAFEGFDDMLLSQVGNAVAQLDCYVHTVSAGDRGPNRVEDFAGLC
jgi:hypothetical protein